MSLIHIFKKVLSPTMLLKAPSILNQVGEGVETNISQGQLNSLVKHQLSTGAEWTIQSVAATGFDGEDYPCLLYTSVGGWNSVRADRYSLPDGRSLPHQKNRAPEAAGPQGEKRQPAGRFWRCLLYTSSGQDSSWNL